MLFLLQRALPSLILFGLLLPGFMVQKFNALLLLLLLLTALPIWLGGGGGGGGVRHRKLYQRVLQIYSLSTSALAVAPLFYWSLLFFLQLRTPSLLLFPFF